MKSPAFRFYADDFLAGTLEMSQEEVGAYVRLLCHQWNRGSIPVEPERQQRLAGGSVSAHVLSKFKACDDGMMRNERLEAERIKQEEYRQKQAEKGRKSGIARTAVEPVLNNGSLPVATEREPETNLPFPFPLPVKEECSKSVGRKVAGAARPTAEEVIKKHSESPAYLGIDVRREWHKMHAWCSANKKSASERRFVNWLNRVEKPIASGPKIINNI